MPTKKKLRIRFKYFWSADILRYTKNINQMGKGYVDKSLIE